MNHIEKPETFDPEALRRQISEIRTISRDEVRPVEPRKELNPLARRIAAQFRTDTYSPTMVLGCLRLFEFAALFIIGYIINSLYVAPEFGRWVEYCVMLAASSALTVVFLQFSDGYQIPILRSVARALPRLLGAWTLGFGVITIVMFFLKTGDAYSRLSFGIWFLTGTTFLLIERAVIAFSIRRWARNGMMERRVVIVGGGQPAKDLIRVLEQQTDNDIRICGIFDDRDERRSPNIIAGYPKLGTFAELIDFARLARIDMLIIALPLSAERRILDLLKKLWILPVDIRLAAHAANLRFRPRSYSHVGQVPMLDIFDKPIADWDSVAKRIFDVVFSIVALVLLWPVFIGAALAVKLSSPGPIIFKQMRHGFNNEQIEVYKFRSMYTDMSDPSARNAVTKGDPRVTPVGRFLRKSSIDELPQIFNVLRGQLSLVGPRPHAVAAQTADRNYSDVVEGYFARHRVKPGVTGWAQINGWRGEIDNDEKIRFRTAFDLHYIENWSLWFDLKILVLTPIRLLNTENAY
ncbi:Undecaprenyl-phosphate glucose phosphotransferase [Rhizobium sp. PP-F2F-G38]|uniref:undecaprenyl-phosphate glucose phosphotransferase n=1 Tax=Rhizobium sp. PP-CC-3G-465 TaxID=2135648 RepID=UPI000D887493|nr:Undecaprenyl-phosphate glucose phosphotransferase [Rhizobium sp. PP-WC-1G-195]PYE99231.1 Undecaprenyl-phosphate glucose phosphotransferase [Rhizobium sp. PP-F2F-G38]TCP87263.1 Undecaprenyl-phosphate glucose phosphotransferase [Rhizobium sp. PP-CC-2G-626]TCQ12594.1 Undecaprenyl-phosphate glucose phosphotransferase [Rhizobium sp. PP-F2F-G36]TCQ28659.1 Undecaprenyl-phosphate glucose phosphotransferase [Rhizobium sp. PP-CC-3G-465]